MRAKGAICGAAHVVSSAREKGTVRWRRESSVMKASAELPRAPMVADTSVTDTALRHDLPMGVRAPKRRVPRSVR